MPRLKSDHKNQPESISSNSGAGMSVPGQFTGKYLVLFREDGIKEGLKSISNASGLKRMCSSADFEGGAVEMSQAEEADVFLLDQLKVAVVNADPTQVSGLQSLAHQGSAILEIEPEQIMYALTDELNPQKLPFDYLRGYRDAVNHLFEELTADGRYALEQAQSTSPLRDTAAFTWGLQATRVNLSSFSGNGVRVAILDTGVDLNHPDFLNRIIQTKSFITGQKIDDRNGHGTHCVGTALGFRRLAGGSRRYGCAYGSEIYVGKVLSNSGSGSDSGILAGINWAVMNQCRVISMSLGAAVSPGEPFSKVYEIVAQRALQSNPGTLIVAAAGNDSRIQGTSLRHNPPRPVRRPANCPSIMAVAAIDARLGVAPFSNGGINPSGGSVDIAAPGVSIFSSWPEPALSPGTASRYDVLDGTSMATPHVAGIAAMWLEARGAGTTAQGLWQLLTSNALPLPISGQDVGAGLVQAP